MNCGSDTADWTAAADQDWIDISPKSGSLVSGQAVQVAVSFGDAAYARTPGVYTGTVNISSAAMGSVVPIPVSLTVRGVDSFAWGAIPLVQMPNVPFAVSLTALDSTGAVVRGFTGTAVLSGTNTTGSAVPITPTVTGSFVQGVWTGDIAVSTATSVRLNADDGAGHTGRAGKSSSGSR